MKIRGNIIDKILAVFILLFVFLCFLVVKKTAATQIQYDPPCSMQYQLTIIEKIRCENAK